LFTNTFVDEKEVNKLENNVVTCTTSFGDTLNKIFSQIQSKEWQKNYNKGYYLFLYWQSLTRGSYMIDMNFAICRTLWEHLFSIHNRNWLTDKKIMNMS
jgi:hypothetical protein